MNYFTSNLTGFTVSEHQSIALREILAGHELLITLQGKIHEAKGDSMWALVHGARISVQSKLGLKYLGFANLHIPYLIRQVPDAVNHYYQVELRLALLPQQLSGIEDHRDGGDLVFEVVVTCATGRGNRTNDSLSQYPTWRIPMPQSQWIQELNNANARRVVLLEVSMPVVESPPHKKAMTLHLQTAERNFMAGMYTECVTECRKGIEALRKVDPNFDWPVLQNRSTREALSKDSRFEALKAVTHLYAYPSAHTGSAGGVSDYTRADAKLALSISAALLSHG